MPIVPINVPDPPRITGRPEEDLINLARWYWNLWEPVSGQLSGIIDRVNAGEAIDSQVGQLPPLGAEATLGEAIAKINDIIDMFGEEPNG